MDFAAEAVLDVIAPPPSRAGAATSASAEADGQGFAAHLEAETAPETPTAPTAQGEASPDASETESAEPAPVKTAKPKQDEPPTGAPIVVQLAAQSSAPIQPAPATTVTATANVTAPTGAEPAATPAHAPTPPQAQGAAPAAAQPAANTTPSAAGADTPPPPATAQAKQAPSTAKSAPAPAADTAAQPAPQVAASAATQGTQPVAPSAQQPAAAAATTPAATAPAPIAQTSPAQQQTQTQQIKPQRAARTDATPDRPDNVAANAKAQTVKPQQAAAAREPIAFAPLADAPEAPSPTPQHGAAPLTVSSAQHAHGASPLDHGAARAAPAAAQVGREIVRRFNGETTRFELRLDPPELGRVEVRLEVSRDHRVTAMIAADSPQALSELARHARDLEQSLQSAGLELSENGLSFDLRQGGEGEADAEQNGHAGAGSAGEETTAPSEPQTAARPIGLERWRGVRVDLLA